MVDARCVFGLLLDACYLFCCRLLFVVWCFLCVVVCDLCALIVACCLLLVSCLLVGDTR